MILRELIKISHSNDLISLNVLKNKQININQLSTSMFIQTDIDEFIIVAHSLKLTKGL